MSDGAKAWDNKREIYVDSGVLVGGRKAIGDLPNWPCRKCATSCRAQCGICSATGCKGKPEKPFMDQQAAKQAKWKLEKSLTPGAAPYIPPGKRGKTAAGTTPPYVPPGKKGPRKPNPTTDTAAKAARKFCSDRNTTN